MVAAEKTSKKVGSRNSWSVVPFAFLKEARQVGAKKDLPVLRSKDPTTQDRPTTAMCCHAHAT